MSPALLIGLGSLITAVVSAIVGAVVLISTTRARLGQEKSADIVAKWVDYADKLEKRFIQMEQQNAAKIEKLTDQILELTKENVRQEGEIKLLSSTVARLQVVTGDRLSSTSTPGLVVSDFRGIIKEANTAVTAILGWSVDELIGQSVERLIPERFLEAHRAGLKAVALGGQLPWSERVILSYALTSVGDEVPVRLRLSGRRIGSEGQIVAEIHERLSSGDSAVIKKADLSEAIAEEARRGEEV